MTSKRELLRDAQVLAPGLQSTQAPTACPACLELIGDRLRRADESVITYLATECPAFFTACMAFITDDWTEERRAETSRVFKLTHIRCRKCNPAGFTMEQLGSKRSAFFIACKGASMVASVGLDRWIGHFHKGNPFAHKRDRWPRCAEDLFPRGADRTADSLATLLDAHMPVEPVFYTVTCAHKPLAFPALCKDHNRTRIVRQLISRARTAASVIALDVAKLPPPGLPAVRTAIAKRAADLCMVPAMTFCALFSHPDYDMTDGAAFVRGLEVELFVALDAVLSQVPKPDVDLPDMCKLAISVWYTIPHAAETLTPPPYVAAVRDDVLRRAQDDYGALHLALADVATRRGCHAPACQHSIHDKAASGAFSCCSSCRVVRYCSRECQREDWKRIPYPHKAVCRILRELVSFADLKASPDAFASACRAHAFPTDHVQLLIQWSTSRQKIAADDVIDVVAGKLRAAKLEGSS